MSDDEILIISDDEISSEIPTTLVCIKRSNGEIDDDWTFEQFIYLKRRNTMAAKYYRLFDQTKQPPGLG